MLGDWDLMEIKKNFESTWIHYSLFQFQTRVEAENMQSQDNWSFFPIFLIKIDAFLETKLAQLTDYISSYIL